MAYTQCLCYDDVTSKEIVACFAVLLISISFVISMLAVTVHLQNKMVVSHDWSLIEKWVIVF